MRTNWKAQVIRMTTTKQVNSVISWEHVDDLLRNPQLNIQSATSPATNAYSFHAVHREQDVHLKPAKYAAGAKPVRHLMILMNCIKIQYLSCSSIAPSKRFWKLVHHTSNNLDCLTVLSTPKKCRRIVTGCIYMLIKVMQE